MALEFVDTNGSFVIPGAYPNVNVQASNSGLAASGILMLVGEADAGPAFDQETDLTQNFFTPDQATAVAAKYKSGPIVDAFSAAASASADAGITGSFAGAVIAKTNVSTKASALLKNPDASNYQTLQDKLYGKLGNLIYTTVTAQQSESLPSVTFTWAPPIGTVNYTMRVNGGASLVPAQLAALATAPTFVTNVNTQSGGGMKATGGTVRGDGTYIIPTGSPTVAVTVNGNIATFTCASNFLSTTAAVAVGDTLWVTSTAAVKGGANQNVGAYVVTAVASNAITALKIANGVGAIGAVLVAPVAVGAIASPQADFVAWAPVTVGLDSASQSTLVQGLGKAFEINELTTGTDLLSRCAFTSAGTVVTWISKTATPAAIGSVAEYIASLNTFRQVDNIQENLIAGGDVVLAIGYKGTTGNVTVTPTTLTTAVVGGTGAALNITLKDFPTVADLAAFINAQTGYFASVPVATQSSIPATALDDGTWNIASDFGAQICRLKADAYKFFTYVAKNSQLVQLAATANAGQPAVTAAGVYVYLAGGTKGGSTNVRVTGAIDALERVRGNFLVPLFSRDAGNVVAGDIADGLTDATSTYTIDAINAYAKSHILKLSTVKRRRNRQGFLSKKDLYATVQSAAGVLSHYRCAVTFQDDKTVTPNGIVQFAPWMTAVKAAAMQAAAFYKSLVHKYVNTSGVVQAAGDWTYNDDGNVESALRSGLLPVSAAPGGGFYFISDQTSYGKDSNFVFNSIQMVYVADIVALTTAQRMEGAFVGQSLADVSAPQALSYLDGIMADFRRLKLIASSDDAKLGYKNAKILITGPAMQVSVEVKISGSIYFIPISFYVTQITQSAGK